MRNFCWTEWWELVLYCKSYISYERTFDDNWWNMTLEQITYKTQLFNFRVAKFISSVVPLKMELMPDSWSVWLENCNFKFSFPKMQFRVAISQKAIIRICRYAPHFKGVSMNFYMQFKFWMETDCTALGQIVRGRSERIIDGWLQYLWC